MDSVSYIAIGVLAALLLWVAAIYNGLVRVKNQVANAWRQIDVQLKRRHDLIPNLVEVVKDTMSYEQETLRQVIEARNRAVAAPGPEAAIPAEAALSGALGRMFALFENYPQLKANDFLAAQRANRRNTIWLIIILLGLGGIFGYGQTNW